MTFFNPKNISLLITSVFAMASCVSDTSEPTPVASGHRMVFDASTLTRGSVTTASNIKGSSFAVYGDMKYSHDTNESESVDDLIDVFLNKSEVMYNTDSTKWICTTQRYWRPNAEHSFVAVHPYSAVHTVKDIYLDNTLSFNYTLSGNYKDTPDLMMATHRRKYKNPDESPATPVRFKFFHIMTRINFLVKCETAKIKVTKVELEGINKTGVYTITPAPLTSGSVQTDDYIHSWSDISNIGTLGADINVDMLKDEVLPLFPDTNALFVIPQPENHEVKMYITYTLYDGKGNELEEQTLTSDTTLGGWEQSKIYSYSFTIKEEGKAINMSVNVKDWEPGSDNNVDVPRK